MGVGKLGFHHARIFRGIPEVESVSIHDTDAARMADVGRELGVATRHALADLLDAVDAAVIAVPTSAHEAVALEALRRGVHVLIEKPLAPSLEAADRILDAAKATGTIVQTGHVERFNGALRACEAHLDGPLFVESHRLAPFRPRGTDVAVVLDLMIHDLDLVLSLVRRPVTSIAGVGVPVLTGRTDIANARIEFEGGAVANLTASRVSRDQKRKIRFFQRSGYISLDLAEGTGEFLRLRPGFTFDPGRPLGVGSVTEAVERVSLEGDGREPLRCELESFVAAVLGREPVAVSGADGRRALAVALEIVERIEEHVADTNPA